MSHHIFLADSRIKQFLYDVCYSTHFGLILHRAKALQHPCVAGQEPLASCPWAGKRSPFSSTPAINNDIEPVTDFPRQPLP